jgi:hypothetical protein
MTCLASALARTAGRSACGTHGPGAGSAACELGQGEIDGRFDVQAGRREDRNGAAGCGDQRLGFGTTKDDAFGAGLRQAGAETAIDLPRFTPHFCQAQLVVDDAVHLGPVGRVLG